MLTFAKKSPELLEYLLTRRSILAKKMQEPGPDRNQTKEILTVAARVPDHGKLSPFYFIVFEGEEKNKVQALLREAYEDECPEASEAKLKLESQNFDRAPTVVVVVSCPRPSKVPIWEQILCAGAACQNLILGANSMGFGAQWLTEWYAYNDVFKDGLGLEKGKDHIAGVIYIGTPTDTPTERDRPNIDDLINYYDDTKLSNTGEQYARKGDLKAGFVFDIEESA